MGPARPAAAFVTAFEPKTAGVPSTLAVLAVLIFSAVPARADFAAGLAAYDGGDYSSAVAAWRPLAEAGDAEAQVALADLYLNGHGVSADPARAAAWYRRAAVQGDAVAQLNLGDLYSRGLGVPRDLMKAYVWLARAAHQGRRWAAARRDEIARQLDPARLAEAQRIAARGAPAEEAAPD